MEQAEIGLNPVLGIEVEDTSRQASRTTTTTLTLPIELGGKRDARIAAAKLARDLAQRERERTLLVLPLLCEPSHRGAAERQAQER